MEEPGRLQSMGSQRVGRDFTSLHPLLASGSIHLVPWAWSCLEYPTSTSKSSSLELLTISHVTQTIKLEMRVHPCLTAPPSTFGSPNRASVTVFCPLSSPLPFRHYHLTAAAISKAASVLLCGRWPPKKPLPSFQFCPIPELYVPT